MNLYVVQAISGQLKRKDESVGSNAEIHAADSDSAGKSQPDTVYCPCESDLSAPLSVMCPAPPSSPNVRIEDMTVDGVDVTWEMPQQNGDAAITVSDVILWSRVTSLCHFYGLSHLFPQ